MYTNGYGRNTVPDSPATRDVPPESQPLPPGLDIDQYYVVQPTILSSDPSYDPATKWGSHTTRLEVSRTSRVLRQTVSHPPSVLSRVSTRLGSTSPDSSEILVRERDQQDSLSEEHLHTPLPPTPPPPTSPVLSRSRGGQGRRTDRRPSRVTTQK